MTDNVKELRDLNLEKAALLARKEAIKTALAEHRDTMTDAEITAKTKDAEEIRTALNDLETKITAAENAVKTENNTRSKIKIMENVTEKVNLRTAFAKHILFESTHRADARPTEAEYRALGVANTTTSTTYVAPSGSVDGVNNGGLFIPETVMMDILRDEELASPIYNDIRMTAIKGLQKYPYKVSQSGAKTKAELSPTDNESVEWRVLSGATGNYTDSIVLTFEVEAMAIEDFTDYLISLIRESMRDLIINDFIYGTGTNDHVYGLTYGAIDAKYAASETDARKIIEAAIKKIPVKKRAGAKIYLATDLFDAITFEKNSNGDYILPVLNGGGLNRISTFDVVADPYLNAGDFVIGNLGKYYKANVEKEVTLGVDISNVKRTKTYAVHAMINAVPVPNSIVYGKKNG